MRLRAYTLVLLAISLFTANGQDLKSNGWPDYGGTLAGQRYSTERQINRSNVGTLQVAWTFHTHVFDKPSPYSNWRASFEATPVLWRNTLYFDTPFDTVFAISAVTGQLKWTFDPGIDREGPIYIVTSRGVALWHAKEPKKGACGSDAVLLATEDRRLIARDAETGAACPAFGNGGTVDLSRGVAIGVKSDLAYTSPPTVVGDTIVLGSSIADNQTTFAASGAVRGFDAVTGRQRWSWEPIRSVTTENSRATGSGNAWSVLSADPDNDLVFVPTGSPSVDFYGGTRPGNNRDADSLVALRASTGQRVWGFQFVHHDLWDYDTPSEPLLFTFRHTIPAVAVVTKTSMLFVFNRLTGQPLYPIEERKVPQSTLPGEHSWPTQPFSTLPPLTPWSLSAADIHMSDASDQQYCQNLLTKMVNHGLFTPPSPQGSVIYPGDLGGVDWGSAAFDPTTSVLYTRVSSMAYLAQELKGGYATTFLGKVERKLDRTLPVWLGGDPEPLSGDFLSPDSGGQKQKEDSGQQGTPYWLAREAFMTPSRVPCAPQPFGSIVAINLDTGRKVWSVAHGNTAPGMAGSPGAGGVIATAGHLIFAASTDDGLLRAYDSSSGKELWHGELPAPAEATPMTYAAGGHQFVVIAAGGHGFIGKGKSDEVVAFMLPAQKQNTVRRQRRR